MRDVGEGAAVHKGEVAFDRLHEVGLHGVEKQREKRARGAEFAAGVGRAVCLDAEHNAVEAAAQVFHVGGEAKNRHQFGSGCDVEARFGRNAVRWTAEARDDVAKHAVVDVHHAAPVDFAQLDLALMARVVKERGKEVVGSGDRMEVAGEVQIDRFHRQHLAVAAAGGAALHAEDRAERRFAQRKNGVAADFLHALRERDARRCLAGAGRHA